MESIIYENDIDMYMKMYCERLNIDDLSKESQNRWHGCMQYVCKNVFKPNPDYLKERERNALYYDVFKVARALDAYISLCNDYSKEVSVYGFCYFIGMHIDTMYSEWAHDDRQIIKAINAESREDAEEIQENTPTGCVCVVGDNLSVKLSCKKSDLFKRINRENERSNSDLLGSSPRTLGIMARLNHKHNWNMPGVHDKTERKALGAESLPVLGGQNVNCLPIINNSDTEN